MKWQYIFFALLLTCSVVSCIKKKLEPAGPGSNPATAHGGQRIEHDATYGRGISAYALESTEEGVETFLVIKSYSSGALRGTWQYQDRALTDGLWADVPPKIST